MSGTQGKLPSHLRVPRSLSFVGISQDESPRLKRVKELGRGPCCVLLDTEFMVDYERDEKDIHADRTVRVVLFCLPLCSA
jgi:hypothetical protein